MLSNLPSRGAKNVVGMCFFLKYDDARMAEIVNAVTGWGVTVEEIVAIGERGLTLARLFNNREGFDAAADRLPEQVMKPHVSGVLSKVRLDPDDMVEQVRLYYRQRGWGDDGVPSRETLVKLELVEYASA
jgi:aldehyde:ferredoxin oxidoreductase